MENKRLALNRNTNNDFAIYDIQRPETGIPGVVARKPTAKTIVGVGSPQDTVLMTNVLPPNNGGIMDEMIASANVKVKAFRTKG
jgi:hypothetical protein